MIPPDQHAGGDQERDEYKHDEDRARRHAVGLHRLVHEDLNIRHGRTGQVPDQYVVAEDDADREKISAKVENGVLNVLSAE